LDFGNVYLFNKKPEDMRRVGALGGGARARNLRFRKASPAPVLGDCSRPRPETTAEAIRRIDVLCPRLASAERREARRRLARASVV
jgi:hypothetical protein